MGSRAMPRGLRACLRAAPFRGGAWSAVRRARRGARRGAAGRRREHCARAGQGAGPQQSALHARKARLAPKRGQDLSAKKRDAARAPPRAAARLWPRFRQKRPRAAAPLAQKCPRPAADFQKVRGRGRISAVRAAAAAALPKHQACRRARAYTHTRARAPAARRHPRPCPVPRPESFRCRGTGRAGSAQGARAGTWPPLCTGPGAGSPPPDSEPCDDPKVVQHHGKEGRYEPRRNRPAARLARCRLVAWTTSPSPSAPCTPRTASPCGRARRPCPCWPQRPRAPLRDRIPRSPCGGVRGWPVREPAVLAAGRVLGDRLGIAACLDGRRVLPDDPLDGLPPGGRHEKAQAPPAGLLVNATGQARGRAGPAPPLSRAADAADHPPAGQAGGAGAGP